MRLTARWAGTVDPRPLATARIAVGLAALGKLIIVAPVLLVLALPDTLRLPWRTGLAPGLATPWLPFALVALWAGAAVAFTAGLATRFAGAVLAAVATLVLVTDRQLYSNHLYLLIVLVALLIVADAGAARSLDSLRRGPRAVPALGPDLVRIQVTIVYAFAALWKLNPEFLSGFVLGTATAGGFVPVPAALRTPDLLAWLAMLTIGFELLVAFGLWSARLRPLAAAIGVALHIGFIAFIHLWDELLVFALLMLGCYPLFFALAEEPPGDRVPHGAPIR